MHTCTLCTSSTACESFWSASRMRSVSLWMMTSRGPCSSRGWLRSSYGQKDSHGSRVMLQTEQSNIHYKKNSYNISLQPIVTLSCKALPSCVINCFQKPAEIHHCNKKVKVFNKNLKSGLILNHLPPLLFIAYSFGAARVYVVFVLNYTIRIYFLCHELQSLSLWPDLQSRREYSAASEKTPNQQSFEVYRSQKTDCTVQVVHKQSNLISKCDKTYMGQCLHTHAHKCVGEHTHTQCKVLCCEYINPIHKRPLFRMCPVCCDKGKRGDF